jgi:hypothetical protein
MGVTLLNPGGCDGDCYGCDGGCCGAETCLQIDFTIGTTGCCDLGTFVIPLTDKTEDADDCIWQMADDEDPPQYRTATGQPLQSVYWLQDYKVEQIPSGVILCSEIGTVDICYSESEAGTDYLWFAHWIRPVVRLSKTTNVARVEIYVGYTFYQTSDDFLCSMQTSSIVLYVFESENCLAGPFDFIGSEAAPDAVFRGWTSPICDAGVDDVYECI